MAAVFVCAPVVSVCARPPPPTPRRNRPDRENSLQSFVVSVDVVILLLDFFFLFENCFSVGLVAGGIDSAIAAFYRF